MPKFKNNDIVKIIDKNSEYFGRHVQVVGCIYGTGTVPYYIVLDCAQRLFENWSTTVLAESSLGFTYE